MLCSPKGLKSGFYGLTLGLVPVVEDFPKGQAVVAWPFRFMTKECVMIEGFLRVAVATPKIKVADVRFNTEAVLREIAEADRQGASLLVFPELVLTAYTCADLFHQTILIERAAAALDEVAEATRRTQLVAVVGVPYMVDHKLYNCAAVLHAGRILALVPKKNLPNYSEFYERRWFTPGQTRVVTLTHRSAVTGEEYAIPFGMNILVEAMDRSDFRLACEICEDVWVLDPPSTRHVLAGATVIANTSASDETVGKDSYRRELIRSTSARLVSVYCYANAGDGESTTDLVFGGQDIIAENGSVVTEGKRFGTGLYIADVDLQRITQERARMTTFPDIDDALRDEYSIVKFRFTPEAEKTSEGVNMAQTSGEEERTSSAEKTGDGVDPVQTPGDAEKTSSAAAQPRKKSFEEVFAAYVGQQVPTAVTATGASAQTGVGGASRAATRVVPETLAGQLAADAADLRRYVDPKPFVPSGAAERHARCDEIFTIQALGLKKRLEHTGCQSAVIGISGGLDSTLALLVIARAFDMLGLPRENIISVTMPAFGTTDRTYNNAVTLTRLLHATLREIDIKAAVLQHFQDIGHDPEDHSVVYENAQARERTQILMDIANQSNGIVIGTGDLSELALGWATYNADHMSMYGVNAGVPKTLVRYLVKFVADTSEDADLARCLNDIFDTPVSPELLPPTGDGQISQKTEDLVGPYELHDFFLYQILRYGFSPRKVYALALHAFSAENQAGMQAKSDDGVQPACGVMTASAEAAAKSDAGVQPAREVMTAAAGTLAAGQAEVYDAATILKWLRKFYWRFFSQQFKRSCLPDGPKVGSIAVSPRGDLRMPSDAVVQIWIDELKELD